MRDIDKTKTAFEKSLFKLLEKRTITTLQLTRYVL